MIDDRANISKGEVLTFDLIEFRYNRFIKIFIFYFSISCFLASLRYAITILSTQFEIDQFDLSLWFIWI